MQNWVCWLEKEATLETCLESHHLSASLRTTQVCVVSFLWYKREYKKEMNNVLKTHKKTSLLQITWWKLWTTQCRRCEEKKNWFDRWLLWKLVVYSKHIVWGELCLEHPKWLMSQHLVASQSHLINVQPFVPLLFCVEIIPVITHIRSDHPRKRIAKYG